MAKRRPTVSEMLEPLDPNHTYTYDELAVVWGCTVSTTQYKIRQIINAGSNINVLSDWELARLGIQPTRIRKLAGKQYRGRLAPIMEGAE